MSQSSHETENETSITLSSNAFSQENALEEAVVEEANLLREQIHDLKQQFSEIQLENKLYRQKLDQLSQIALEREKKIAVFQQQEQSFLQKLHDQRLALNSAQEKHFETLRSLQYEKEALSKELGENQQHVQQLGRVIRFLREKHEEAQLNAKQFQDDFHGAQTAMLELNERIAEALEAKQKYESALKQEQWDKQAAIEETEALYAQFQSLKQIFSDLKEEQEKALLLKQEEVSDLKASLAEQIQKSQALLSEKELLKEEFSRVQQAKEEMESRLKMAQHHLAKKVRETSELNDKVHAQEMLLHELQSQLNQSHQQASDLQQAIENKLLLEQRLQEQIQETTRSSEAIAQRWEEKYCKIYEKWQQSLAQLKEMKKLEERQSQIQALLTNLGGVFASPYSPPVHTSFFEGPSGFSHDVLEEQLSEEMHAPMEFSEIGQEGQEEVVADMDRPYKNLFDLPKQYKTPSNNLFTKMDFLEHDHYRD